MKNEPLSIPDTDRDRAIASFAKGENLISENEMKQSDIFYEYVIANSHLCRRYVGERKFPQINTNGICSTYTGPISIRTGTRPQNYSKPGDSAVNFYLANKPLFDEYEVDVENAVIVNGCFDTNKVILERTAVPEDVPDSLAGIPTIDDILKYSKAIKATIRKLRIEPMQCCHFEDALQSHFRDESQPGFTQYYVNKNLTKSAARKSSVYAARRISRVLDKIACTTHKELVKEFIAKKPDCKGLYAIGARNKRAYDEGEKELATSRAVHMPEFHNELVIAPWIDAINDQIKAKDKGPLYIGNSITRYERFMRDIDNAESYLEGDYSRFDSTIRVTFLIISTAISRLYFPLYSKRADVIFFYLFYVITIKDYYLPGGIVVRIIHGLPSGSKCTTIFNSICNLFILLRCAKHLDYRKLSFAVGGDDFVVLCKFKITETENECFRINSEELGMKFKFCDIKKTESNRVSDFPFFYKYSVRKGVPIISPQILLERIFVPFNKRIDNNFDYLDFMEAQIPLLGYPSTTHLPFYAFYKYLYNSVNKDKNNFKEMSIGAVYKMHKSAYGMYRYSYIRRSSLDNCIGLSKNVRQLMHRKITIKDKLDASNLILSKNNRRIYKFKDIL